LSGGTVAAAAVVGAMSLGEHLWRRFLPKYLESMGAPAAGIGLFGTLEDFLDGTYQYPGGWLGDRLGHRAALRTFIGLAALGYAIYWWAAQWQWLLVGLVFAMAWRSMASPTLFAIIGDALPANRRAMGFTVQAIVKRIPIAVAPLLGGLAIATAGVQAGVRALLVLSIGLAAVAVLATRRIAVGQPPATHQSVFGIWAGLPVPLKRLLLSDVFIRTCEGMVDVFLVLYATNVVALSAPQFGILLAVQALTSILVYVPVSRWSDRGRRKPFVAATFLFFAAFPAAVVLSGSFAALVAAFVVGGLREVGEPSRKAMIVGLVAPGLRGRSVGLYYLVRSLAVSPAALVGGLLWTIDPALPFVAAAAIGLIGTAVFVATVDERTAG
jgi:MFS family permease